MMREPETAEAYEARVRHYREVLLANAQTEVAA
jgi:hypothetical protein